MPAVDGDSDDRQTYPIGTDISNALRLAEPLEKNVTDCNHPSRQSPFVKQQVDLTASQADSSNNEESSKGSLFGPACRKCHQQSLCEVHEKWKGAKDRS